MSGQGYLPKRLLLELMAGGVLLIGHGALVHAEDRGQKSLVELDCRLAPNPAGLRLKSWLVEVRKSDGAPVRSLRKFGGDLARFKDLEPGIYLVCIEGEGGRKRCESVDLTPPAGSRFFRFEKELKTPPPPLQRSDAHRISLRQLSISRDAWLEMGRWRLAQLRGKTREAIQHLERALLLSPDYPEALNNLGVHYLNQHNYNTSTQYLQRATESDPDFYAAWVNLGACLLAAGEFNRALDANKRAYALRPDDAAVNSQLGMNYYYLRNYPEAEKYFEKAMALDPVPASSPQLFLAQMSIIQKKDVEARQYIQDFLYLHPNSPQGSRLREVMRQVGEKQLVAVPSADPGVGP